MEKESEYAGRLMSYETQKAFRKKFLKNWISLISSEHAIGKYMH